MNIKEFKKGDFITRVKKIVYASGQTDASYIGTCFQFVGFNSSKIILIELNQYSDIGSCKITTLSTDSWEEGWDYYSIDEMREAQLELLSIAKAILNQEENKSNLKKGQFKKGQLVKTCDDRYGFIKQIDWHAKMFIGRDDYQIQFPDGVGIFRQDEFEIIENPPVK